LDTSLTDSFIDTCLCELAATLAVPVGKCPALDSSIATGMLELSRDFSDYSSFNSDISGELERLALVTRPEASNSPSPDLPDLDLTSSELLDTMPLESLEPVVKLCIEKLSTSLEEEKRKATAQIRLLAKHRSDLRELIGASGAIPVLVPLLKSTDPATQEGAVTALLNLSLEENNKAAITAAGAIKPFVYALRTGTGVAKQNAACALLSLSMIEDNRATIGACGAVPPLVSLLVHGSTRGKKDALTTLYKLCSIKRNKERAVDAGAVGPLVRLVTEGGLSEKAMVVLRSLAGVLEGKGAIVEEGGIQALVEAIEDGPEKGKEFAVAVLLQLCADNVLNRSLLVREGAIPPLVALSQTGSARAKQKVPLL
jgi:Armadillo/beta-catenin-like repeat